ncbi:MAG TPA: hypothetical protein VGO11_10870, partial [Chthoniobacteraceae bacterium]|nr:hypothetical protein [Chthoniobacteraceae bacterium]
MQLPTWIRARNLDAWAKSQAAKGLLPELISRLVRATTPVTSLTECDFATEAEVHRPGYDGTTVSAAAGLYVPTGICYWEAGTGDPARKAEEDYQKRIAAHHAKVETGEVDDLTQVTFVAVTLRDWHDKKAVGKKGSAKGNAIRKRTQSVGLGGSKAWAKEKSKEGIFREVRAYDSKTLEQWIQEAPAVGLWLARQLGVSVEGMRDIGSYWSDVQAALARPLSPEVLLVNRSQTADAFRNWISEDAAELPVRAPSAAEVIATFAAWVHTLPPKEADAISARAVVVESRATWDGLSESLNALILIADPRLDADNETFSRATRKGHHVLRYADTRSSGRNSPLQLERMRRFDLQQVLRNSGLLSDVEAEQLAEAA